LPVDNESFIDAVGVSHLRQLANFDSQPRPHHFYLRVNRRLALPSPVIARYSV